MVDTPDHVHIRVTADGPVMTTSETCTHHADHRPKTHVNEIHHVWPLGEGGPNIAANRTVICATGHNNVHALLNLYKKYGQTPPFTELSRWGREEQRLAALGWSRMQKGSM